MWEVIDWHWLDFNSILQFEIWNTATLSTWPLQITNIERSNLIKYPQFFDKFVIDPSTFEYDCMYGENV